MGPAGFLVAFYQRGDVGVHEQHAVGAAHALQAVQRMEQLVKAVALPNVHHQRHPLIAILGGHAQLRKAGYQRHRQIVHAVVIQILQDIGGPALAGAGHAGDDKKFHYFSPAPPEASSCASLAACSRSTSARSWAAFSSS